MQNINGQQAKQLALHGQGLLLKDPFGLGQEAVLRTIEQLHYLQIDTISVVDRTQHQVLKTRISDYQPAMLHALQSEHKKIFEYWSHAAAYLPMKDYRFYQPVMRGYQLNRQVDEKIRRLILARLKAEGPLMAKDFATPAGSAKRKGWWDWKPAKIALERMYMGGELMVAERRGFQKVYDLTNNVLPDNTNLKAPTDQQRGKFYVSGMLKNLGIASPRDIAYARSTVKRLSKYDILASIETSLHEMTEAGEVSRLSVQDETLYCLTESLSILEQPPSHKCLYFLSPFDNLIINRERLRKIFNFDYKLECYVPKPKRQFGVFYATHFIRRRIYWQAGLQSPTQNQHPRYQRHLVRGNDPPNKQTCYRFSRCPTSLPTHFKLSISVNRHNK
ncbi:MAG: winged helix DNA-binding domain-containing protein [Pseudomonadales bacterium]|nr:winged helix DNA-binding domain-containing protein [Pseudomonadales bacterium]